MPYQRRGKYFDMPKPARAGIIAGIALVVIAVALTLFYFIAPRDFLQLFLSKSQYAQVTLYENLKEDIPKLEPTIQTLTADQAYLIEGTNDIQLSDQVVVAIGNEEEAVNLATYLDTIRYEGQFQLSGGQFKNTLTLKDSDGTVSKSDLVKSENAVYLNLEELPFEWIEMATADIDDELVDRQFRSIINSQDEKVRKRVGKIVKKAYKSVRKDIVVRSDSDMTFGVGTKSATGDRMNIILEKEHFVNFVTLALDGMAEDEKLYETANESLSKGDRFHSFEEFSDYIREQEEKLVDAVEETGVTRVSLDFYTNRRNRVVGFEALVKREQGDLIAKAILEDDEDKGPAFQVRSGQTVLFALDLTRTETEDGNYKGTAVIESKEYQNTVSFENAYINEKGLLYGDFSFEPITLPGYEHLSTVVLDLSLSEEELVYETKTNYVVEFEAGSLGRVTLEGTISDDTFSDVTLPLDASITTVEDEDLAKAMVSYLFEDMAETHDSFSSLVTENSFSRFLEHLSTILTPTETKAGEEDE